MYRHTDQNPVKLLFPFRPPPHLLLKTFFFLEWQAASLAV